MRGTPRCAAARPPRVNPMREVSGAGIRGRRGHGCLFASLGCREYLAALLLLLFLGTSQANVCRPATSGGSAASDWSTFCWLDFTGYNDTTARSAAGQNFSFTLNDGSTLSLNVRAVRTGGGTALDAVAAPSW